MQPLAREAMRLYWERERDSDGEPDSLGIPGTLEEAVGNRTLARRSHGLFDSTEALVAAHLSGDAYATRVWLRSVYKLACAVTSMINVLDPDVIVLGGGMSSRLFQEIREKRGLVYSVFGYFRRLWEDGTWPTRHARLVMAAREQAARLVEHVGLTEVDREHRLLRARLAWPGCAPY
mgnify:CR=1 FL=1